MIQPQLSDRPGGIMLLTGAPRDEDTIKGLPLVGGDGMLLSHALRAAGMTDPTNPPYSYMRGHRGETRRICWERRAYSFLTVFHDPIPKDDIKAWCMQAPERKALIEAGEAPEGWTELPRIEGAGWLRPEHMGALARLKKEIEACSPQLIVPMGGIALWALTGEAAIDTYRGAIGVASRLASGTKLLPTYEPAFVLQQYKMLSVLVGDLLKAKREAAYPEVRLQPREIWLEPSVTDLSEFRDRHLSSECGPLSVDIETTRDQISCISFSPTAYTSLIVPFVDYRKSDRSYWQSASDEEAAWKFVAEVLDSPVEKLFQNGVYDVYWFLEVAKIPVRNWRHDLRLVHKTLYPELPASLKFMGATYANVHAWKAGAGHTQEKRDA